VVLMAERHGLVDGHADVGGISRTSKLGDEPAQPRQDKDEAENADLGDDVEAAVKNLGHRCHLRPGRWDCGRRPPRCRENGWAAKFSNPGTNASSTFRSLSP